MTARDAIVAHVNWKLKIHALLSGRLPKKLDPSTIEKDNVCEFGRWLHSDGERSMLAPQHAELIGIHAEFHREAARIVRETYAGRKIGHDAIGMNSLFSKLTARIVGILARMDKN